MPCRALPALGGVRVWWEWMLRSLLPSVWRPYPVTLGCRGALGGGTLSSRGPSLAGVDTADPFKLQRQVPAAWQPQQLAPRLRRLLAAVTKLEALS